MIGRILALSCACVAGLVLLADSASAMKAEIRGASVRLSIDGVQVTGLRANPGGRDAFGPSFVKALKPEFWESTGGTGVEVTGSHAVVFPLAVWDYRRTDSAGRCHEPDRLESGHTLAQSFRIADGFELNKVSVKLPTWHSKTSGATLSLYRGSELVARRQMKRVEDNSTQAIAPPSPAPAGDYRVEISDPSGTIGWWSSREDILPDGEAFVDGKPVPGDRAIVLETRRNAGDGRLSYTIDGDRLTVKAEVLRAGDVEFRTLPWRWRTTWKQSGYDCDAEAGVLFSRFFSDTQRYMPIEQLKRRSTGGLSFDGCKWIEMDGTSNADLLLEGDGLHLHWEMQPSEMSLRFDTPMVRQGDTWFSEWALTVKPREDSVPELFPRFACSDKAIEEDLNRFWWERGFTYPSAASGSAEWFEWMALMRGWFAGRGREGEMRAVQTCPITDEGYVHTWGGTIGWPLVRDRDTRHFDTNARLILACWRHYLWTGDKAFLQGQKDRLREAMSYQLDVLKGRDGLIVTPEIKTGRHEDLTNNYWDILPFGHLDAYANAVFFGSISAMEQIDSALGQEPLTDYAALRTKAHRRYDEVFWDDQKGRYIGCVDIDGEKHDYGFTFVNLEAIFYGLGDAAKAERIYRWMETEPTSSGKPDTYSKWVFAPRATTIHNPMWREDAPKSELASKVKPWWTFWWRGTPFGDQCQDGGAILYTSFFDLMDRARYRGADNAWQRFSEILERYRMPDRLCGGKPLYRGEKPQQEDAGSVGVDLPFPESGLVPCYFLYGVIGVEPTPEGLRISPRLPKALDYAEVRNIDWHGMSLRVRVTSSSVEVEGADAGGRPFTMKRRILPGGSVLIRPEDHQQ